MLRNTDWLEEARSLARLVEEKGLSQEQAAARFGMSQSAVANKLRLLKHPQPVLEAIRQAGLSERHARALLRLPEESRPAAVETIARGNYNVARTEQYIESLLPGESRHREVGIFLRTLNKTVDMVRLAGIDCRCGRQETEGEIVLTIRLPKIAAY